MLFWYVGTARMQSVCPRCAGSLSRTGVDSPLCSHGTIVEVDTGHMCCEKRATVFQRKHVGEACSMEAPKSETMFNSRCAERYLLIFVDIYKYV